MLASVSEQAKGSAGDVAAGMMAVLEMETGVGLEAGWLSLGALSRVELSRVLCQQP
jgi:ABC-type hemin transport system ATPase subunit